MNVIRSLKFKQQASIWKIRTLQVSLMTSDVLNVFGLPTLVNTCIGRTGRRSTNQKYQLYTNTNPLP